MKIMFPWREKIYRHESSYVNFENIWEEKLDREVVREFVWWDKRTQNSQEFMIFHFSILSLPFTINKTQLSQNFIALVSSFFYSSKLFLIILPRTRKIHATFCYFYRRRTADDRKN